MCCGIAALELLISMSNVTPMVRQYKELKAQHPGTLLFFRLGDFYELFFDDAVTGARELQITLTARHKDSSEPIPMCGELYRQAGAQRIPRGDLRTDRRRVESKEARTA